MAGTGDVVMTDVRQNSRQPDPGHGPTTAASSCCDAHAAWWRSSTSPRPAGGAGPGARAQYQVYFEQEKKFLSTSFTLGDGQRQELVRDDLRKERRLPTRLRGDDPGQNGDLLDGRVRIEAGWNTRFTFLHWIRPDIGLQLTYGDRTFGADRTVLLGARYYLPSSTRVRPHAGLAVGRYDIPTWGPVPGPPTVPFHQVYGITGHRAEVGVAPEVGLDLYLGRHFNFSLTSQASFAGGHSSIDTWVGVGFTFGGPGKK